MNKFIQHLFILCFSFFVWGCEEHNQIINTQPENPPKQENESNSIPEVPVMPDITSIKKTNYVNTGYEAVIEYKTEGKAQLSVYPISFDLATVVGNLITGSVATPGIIPGTVDLIADVEISKTNNANLLRGDISYSFPIQIPKEYAGNEWEIYGEGENDFIKYNLSGVLDGNKGIIYLTSTPIENIKGHIDNSSNWMLNHFEWDSDGIKTSPFFIEWKSSFALGQGDALSASDFMQLLMNIPFLPGNSYGLMGSNTNFVSLGYLLQIISPIIKFDDNRAFLMSLCECMYTESPTTIEPYQSFPKATFTYAISRDNEIRLFINPGGMFDVNVAYLHGVGGEDLYYPMNTPDLYALISNFLLGMSSNLKDGIPFKLSINDNSLNWYIIDSKICINLLRQILLPIFDNEVNLKRLLRAVREDSRYSKYAKNVEVGIEALPQMFEDTEQLKFGLSASVVDIDNQDVLLDYLRRIN